MTSSFQTQGTWVSNRHQTLALDLTLAAISSSASPTGGAGSAAVTVWRDRFGLNVDIGIRVDGQCSALRYVAHWPREMEWREQKAESNYWQKIFIFITLCFTSEHDFLAQFAGMKHIVLPTLEKIYLWINKNLS